MSIKPIRSEEDYDNTLVEIDGLWSSQPGTEEGERLEVLVVLVQDYERVHYPIGPPDLASAVEYEMDKRGLTRQDKNMHEDIIFSKAEYHDKANSGQNTSPARAKRTKQSI